MPAFQLVSPFQPAGDQPQAIESLVEGLREGKANQTLLGVTGSGKTFTMANVIAQYGKPALVMSHNKTLAAQLYAEFKEFFPHNAVRYFVSYYDYYQPEAYIPQRDIYIEKDASINEEIERLRLACTSALVSREDVIVVASVSCIYGLGSPEDYRKMMVRLQVGDMVDRDEMLLKFVDIQYDRNDVVVRARASSGCAATWSSSGRPTRRSATGSSSSATRSSGWPIDRPAHRRRARDAPRRCTSTRPSTSSCPRSGSRAAVEAIGKELDERLQELKEQGKLLEAQRLAARTRYDMEMLLEVGYCSGIENYSPPPLRPQARRDAQHAARLLPAGQPADPRRVARDGAADPGDVRRRPQPQDCTLVEHGFRLPSALDNRPLRFDEWEQKFDAAAVRLGHARPTTRSRCPAARSSSR